MENIVKDLFTSYQGDYQKVNLFTDLKSKITVRGKAYVIEEANKYLGYEYPYISATMYMKFKRNGNRVDFEDVYFAKRRVLNALVLGEYIEGNGRFLDDIINGIFSICEESGWQLPPHNSYIRDTPQLILPDSEHPVMDLFACETGALLATIYHLLKDSLDEVSPFICSRILSELQKRIITPYLTEHFWWMGNGDEPMCNWTIWCTQNVLLTAAQIPVEKANYKAILQKACGSVDYFLKDYGEDGCCDEGAHYYRHAGLCLSLSLDLLNRICHNAFASLWSVEKIKNIAEYICNVHVDGPYYINFADCSPLTGEYGSERCGVREFLFGKAIGSEALCSFAALDFADHTEVYMPNEINLSYRLLTLLHESELLAYATKHPKQIPSRNIWYESVGIYLAKTPDTCLAVKAGDNDDNHNHNDTGSIILYEQGKPVLIDVGVASYTQKTFSPERYEIWTMQSGYHNLPTIGGCDQLAGAAYKAINVKTSLITDTNSAKLNTISMELQEAYPQSCQLLSYKRTVSLEPTAENNQKDLFTLTDTYAFDDHAKDTSVILNFMSCEKPAYKDNILTIGSLSRYVISGISDCQIEEIPITDRRLMGTWNGKVYRIRFFSNCATFSMKTYI